MCEISRWAVLFAKQSHHFSPDKMTVKNVCVRARVRMNDDMCESFKQSWYVWPILNWEMQNKNVDLNFNGQFNERFSKSIACTLANVNCNTSNVRTLCTILLLRNGLAYFLFDFRRAFFVAFSWIFFGQ